MRIRRTHIRTQRGNIALIFPRIGKALRERIATPNDIGRRNRGGTKLDFIRLTPPAIKNLITVILAKKFTENSIVVNGLTTTFGNKTFFILFKPATAKTRRNKYNRRLAEILGNVLRTIRSSTTGRIIAYINPTVFPKLFNLFGKRITLSTSKTALVTLIKLLTKRTNFQAFTLDLPIEIDDRITQKQNTMKMEATSFGGTLRNNEMTTRMTITGAISFKELSKCLLGVLLDKIHALILNSKGNEQHIFTRNSAIFIRNGMLIDNTLSPHTLLILSTTITTTTRNPRKSVLLTSQKIEFSKLRFIIGTICRKTTRFSRVQNHQRL